MTKMIYFDRSRRETWEHCPRKRYYAYELDGRGVSPVRAARSSWPLMTGTGIHAGIENLLNKYHVDVAVIGAMQHSGYLDLPPAEDDRETFLRNEQIALIEGLTRCWATTQLASFTETYEVLDVEREEVVELAPGVRMMVRPDLLVRRKVDGALFTWQLKSTKRCDERWTSQWAIDQMTISEALAVEARLGEKMSGVIIQGLLKGEQLEYPRGSGQWYHNSPLIWAWKNESGKPHPRREWSARYEWTDEEGNHRLGKGWRKAAIWQEYVGGVKTWIERLAQLDPAVLMEQIVTLPPVLRNDFDVARWRRAVENSERVIRQTRSCTNEFLDAFFPMHTSSGNCLWPYKCDFYAICHEGADPHDEQLYQIRELNHSTEVIE